MSLSVDGIWKVGVWDQTVWAAGVWREGTAKVATLSGTVVPSVLADEIVVGGETLIITLDGDTWVTAGATFEAQRLNILQGLDADTSQTNGWNAEVRDKEVATAVVRTSNTVATITFTTAAAGYAITESETITVTIPATALTGGSELVASATFLAADVLVAHKDETIRHNRSTLRHQDQTLDFKETDLEHNR